MDNYNQLQIREIFHLEFLRWFGRKVKAHHYALKGGANLRFFFSSFRYSEDMDLDVSRMGVGALKEITLNILNAAAFQDMLKPFGVQRVIAPDMSKAKQTETTQRFKIHLIVESGEDLFTKIEFSRRGFNGKTEVSAISENILRQYKLAPLLVSHYDIGAAIGQKITALVTRKMIQARDAFDLYVLSTQFEAGVSVKDSEVSKFMKHEGKELKLAQDNIYEMSFEQFRDTVLSYLSPQDQQTYSNSSSWDEIKLKAVNFINELRQRYD